MNPLYQLDQNIFRALHVDMHRDWLDPIMVFITDTGRGEVKFAILLVFCFMVRYRAYAWLAISAGIASGTVSQIVKQFVSRDRPSNFDYANPIVTYIESLSGQLNAPMGDNSFPSGHATSTFGIAVALAWALRGTEYSWLGWVLIGWASLVSISRVYIGVHFLSDVLAGAALGAIFGTLFFMLWRKKGWIQKPLSH